MRIQELRLEKFGHFEDVSLDLSGDDVLLHVIHGPNEAGKSTALVAISDLLFGMPKQTPYNFLHPYGSLRIGATLSNSAGQTLSFKRRKAPAGSLLKSDESGSLPDSALLPYLGGATREFFERMYGLNHERLRRGGKDMLDAGGDVARSLFEAGGGISGFSEVVLKLAEEADAIGSPKRKSATKPYWQAHGRYEQAVARVKADALKADAWKAAEEAIERAKGRREELQAQLRDRRKERSALERLRRVAPILKRIDDHEVQLRELGDGPALPEGFAETWRKATQGAHEAEAEVKRRAAELEGLREELADLGDPGRWPEVADRVDDLAIRLGDYRSKCTDLPHRERDLERGREQIVRLLRQLGADLVPQDAGQRAPSALVVERVRKLVSDWNRLDQQLLGAREEAEQAAGELRQAEQQLEEAGAPSDPTIAEAAFEAAQVHGDVVGRLSTAKTDLEAATENLAAALSAVGRWTGSADELSRTAFPSSEAVLQLDEDLRRFESEQAAIETERGRLRNDVSRCRGELAALQAVGEVPTEDALRSVRERRDQGWRLIRRHYVEGGEVAAEDIGEFAPAGELADVYEEAVVIADRMADSREREANRIERFASFTGELEKAEQNLANLAASEKELLRRGSEWDTEWAALWGGTGVKVGMPAEMKRWLLAKDEVLAKHHAVWSAQRTARAAEDELADVRAQLLEAAAELGIEVSASAEVAPTRQRVSAALEVAKDRCLEAENLRRSVVERRRRASQRSGAVERLEVVLAEWKEKWTAEMPSLGLPPSSSTAEAEAALDIWQEIGTVLTDMEQTRRRHDQMKDTIEAYEAEVRVLLNDLGDAPPGIDEDAGCSAVVPVLQRHLAEAQQLSARVGDARARRVAAETAFSAAEETASSAAAELQAIRDTYGLPEDADVVSLAANADRRRVLTAALAADRQALADQGDGLEESDLRAATAEVDMDVTVAEIGRLEDEAARLQEELEQAAREVAVAERHLADLRNREGAGEAAQQANDAAAEMLAHAERWLRLKAANIVLGRAIERYREANEDPLIRRASEIFSTIAANGDDPIVRLSVDYTDETKPVLVGYRRDGQRCTVSGMSDGTRDQLYLALRIAAVERHIGSAEPLPFVVDDLFITSDEARTAPGIEALAELGRHTQVLLFTHHRYVVEAASQALAPNKFKVHALDRYISEALEVAE